MSVLGKGRWTDGERRTIEAYVQRLTHCRPNVELNYVPVDDPQGALAVIEDSGEEYLSIHKVDGRYAFGFHLKVLATDDDLGELLADRVRTFSVAA